MNISNLISVLNALLMKRFDLINVLKALLKKKSEISFEISGVKLEMVKCPAGCFMMGSKSNELGRKNNETQHLVTISKDFYICKFLVTKALYRAVLGQSPAGDRLDRFGDDIPAYNVNSFQAECFCYELNKLKGLNKPSGYLFDLPTEAQWEYACRAGTTTSLNSGKNITNVCDCCLNLDEVAWYSKNSNDNPHPVGLKKPNAWGIYDMHGNVWEWCKDLRDTGDYGPDSVTDPTGPDPNDGHHYYKQIIRGGGYTSWPSDCRSASRSCGNSGSRPVYWEIGFRVVLAFDEETWRKVEEDRAKKEAEDRARKEAEVRARKEAEAKAKNSAYVAQEILKEMIKCPAGSFIMGSSEKEKGRRKDEIQHKVTLSKDFFIAKYPITQFQYRILMDFNPSWFKCDDAPVECVDWYDAIKLCTILNNLTTSTRPAGYRFDLPTEAQWEYACRAGLSALVNIEKYAVGNNKIAYITDELAWYNDNSNAQTHSVGLKKPNAWGIYDMLGNIWEWCKDLYGDYTTSCVVDPKGAPKSPHRVARGGSWHSKPDRCRSASRNNLAPYCVGHRLGFRIALVPEE